MGLKGREASRLWLMNYVWGCHPIKSQRPRGERTFGLVRVTFENADLRQGKLPP